MEQLDTDEKLVENSKDKKKSSFPSHYVLIGVICFVILFAIVFLFKIMNSQGSDSNKKSFIIHFLYYRQKISCSNS